MRGGAIPILAWGTLLLVLFGGNWIWEGRPIQVGPTAFAILAVYTFGLLLWLARRESIRKGPPPPRTETEALPQASLASALVGVSAGAILFGVVWSNFFVYFGAGLMLLSLGRLVVEVRAERRSRERYER